MRAAMVVLGISVGLGGPGFPQEKSKPEPATQLDSAVVEKIEALGGSARAIAHDTGRVEVSFHLGRNQQGLRRLDTSKAESPPTPSLDGQLGILKKLKIVGLNLGGTDVTDKGLSHLAALTSLTRLHLEKTKVSDAGLTHLKGLQYLTSLNLYQTNVTDEGLRHLEGLKNLKNLYLWQTNVTPGGVKKLQQLLPNCEINLGWEAQKALSASESEGKKP